MKKLLTLALLITSFVANAQIIDDGTGYNEFREINGSTLAGQAAGSLTTSYTFLDTSKRKLETVGLRCVYCVSNSEITSTWFTLTGDVKGTSNLYKSTALRYSNTQWITPSIDGLVLTTANTTHFTEVANNQIPNIPGARIRVVIQTTGSPITTPFVKFVKDGKTIIPFAAKVPTNTITDIHVEFWNFGKLRTNFQVETLDLSAPTPTCE